MHTSLSLSLTTSFAVFCATVLFLFSAVPAEAQIKSSLMRSKTEFSNASSSPSISCMSTAIGVRENALMADFENYSDAIISALENRKKALSSAWEISDSKTRNAALRTARKEWRSASLAAHKELRADRKTAWDTFKKTAKNECRVSVPKEEDLDKAKADSITL